MASLSEVKPGEVREVKLTKSQIVGYRLFIEKVGGLEKTLQMVKEQANEFLSECLREAGQTPGPDWTFDKNKVTFFRQTKE